MKIVLMSILIVSIVFTWYFPPESPYTLYGFIVSLLVVITSYFYKTINSSHIFAIYVTNMFLNLLILRILNVEMPWH